MAEGKGTEIEIKNLGEKTGIKLIADDQGKVVIATEENVPLQPTKPDGKLDEYAIHDNEPGEISAIAPKASPVSTDVVLGEDSENGFAKVKFAVGDLGGGGGGATSFDGLSDTPVDKSGADGFLVKVNGVNLDFLDPGTFALVGHNHDAAYAPISHSHPIGEITGFDPADFLPLAGGIMTGDIDFQGPTEGIRFWDTDSAFFRAFYLDTVGTKGLVIGGDAVGLGGFPPVTAETFQFNVGVNGGGSSLFAMWEDTAGDFLVVMAMSDGGDFEAGPGDRNFVIKGSETRPQYDAGGGAVDLALLSDVGGGSYDAAAVPQYGTGPLHVHFLSGIAVILSPYDSNIARVSARDMIHSIKGSAGTLQFKIDGSIFGGPGPSSQSTDPTAAYIDFTTNEAGQQMIVQVTVFDGVGNQHTGELFVIVQDPYGLANP